MYSNTKIWTDCTNKGYTQILILAAEDQCSTKCSELANTEVGRKHWCSTNHFKWQDNMANGTKSKLFADIYG